MASFHADIVKDCAANFIACLKQKLKDWNKAKSNCADPHRRTVVTYPIRKHVYSLAMADMFRKEEKQYANDHGNQFFIKTLDRVIDIFGGEAAVKLREDGDRIIICPWSVMCNDVTEHGLMKGRLVIPLSSITTPTSVSKSYDVFVPCGGPEEKDGVFEYPDRYNEFPNDNFNS